jgi:tetratricopeptide (TPR) repeat protein
MKRNWLLVFCLAGLSGGCGLFSKKENKGAHDIAVYHQAMKVGDFNTAITAIHWALAKDSAHWQYYDTLGVLYFRSNQYPQAVLASQQFLAHDPRNEKMLNITARSFEFLEMQDSALIYFQRLEALNQNPEYLYQIATTQLKVNDWEGADASAQKVVADPRADTMKMIISANDQQQVVPLKAAAYNLLGTIRHTQMKNDEAREYFQKSLALAPDFTLVENNLKRLENDKK